MVDARGEVIQSTRIESEFTQFQRGIFLWILVSERKKYLIELIPE
jgi:hypothetical protein